MPKQLESVGQKRLTDRLSADGWFVTKIQSTNRAGFPDLLCFKVGESPLLIECKANGGKRSGRQKLVAEQLTKAGCSVKLMDVSGVAVEISDNPIVRRDNVGF